MSIVDRIRPSRRQHHADVDRADYEDAFEKSEKDQNDQLDSGNPHVKVYLEMIDRGSDFESESAEVPRFAGGATEDEAPRE